MVGVVKARLGHKHCKDLNPSTTLNPQKLRPQTSNLQFQVMVGVVKARLGHKDCKDRGWLLDGLDPKSETRN